MMHDVVEGVVWFIVEVLKGISEFIELGTVVGIAGLLVVSVRRLFSLF